MMPGRSAAQRVSCSPRRRGGRPALARLTLMSMLAIAAVNHPARAQGLDPALARRIDAAVLAVLHADHAPSASIAIVRDGHLVYTAAYGYARLSPAVRATTKTRYQIASISKSITAQALLLLEQDGKLSLEDRVSRWVEELPDRDEVTVRQLLQHTSGFPDHYPQTYPAGPRVRPIAPDAIVAEWGRHPLLFEPGTHFRYSNLNYVVAGLIAEKAAAQPFFQFLQDRIFAPLGMTATVNVDDVGPQTANLATGYVRYELGNLRPAPTEGQGWSFGAGQVVTTAGDLARWDEGFLAGKLLRPKEAAQAVLAPKLADGSQSSYALGMFIATQGERTMLYHVGQGLGFLAVNRIYPKEQAAIVVLTNDSSSAAFAHIAERLAYIVVPPTTLDAQARALFKSIQVNRLDRRLVSSDFDTYFDARRSREAARTLGPLGEPESFDLRSEDQADGLTTRVYAISVRNRHLRLVEQVLADGRIESLEVHAGQ